jgi:hypothetical protein
MTSSSGGIEGASMEPVIGDTKGRLPSLNYKDRLGDIPGIMEYSGIDKGMTRY